MAGRLIVGTDFDVETECWRDGAQLDLAGATDLVLKFIKPSGNVILKTPIVVDPDLGILRAHILDTENDETGPWIGSLRGMDGAGYVISGYTPDLYLYPQR